MEIIEEIVGNVKVDVAEKLIIILIQIQMEILIIMKKEVVIIEEVEEVMLEIKEHFSKKNFGVIVTQIVIQGKIHLPRYGKNSKEFLLIFYRSYLLFYCN